MAGWNNVSISGVHNINGNGLVTGDSLVKDYQSFCAKDCMLAQKRTVIIETVLFWDNTHNSGKPLQEYLR